MRDVAITSEEILLFQLSVSACLLCARNFVKSQQVNIQTWLAFHAFSTDFSKRVLTFVRAETRS